MSQRSPCLWTSLPQCAPAPCDRYKHASCAHGGEVYLLGGREKHSLKDFWRYNVVRNEWTELDCSSDGAPEELEEHSMVAHQGIIYVFGGMIDSAYTRMKTPLWMFDTVKERWVYWQGERDSSQDLAPVNRKGHSAVVFGSSMYIYGGYVDMRGSSQEFWRFDFDTRVWSLLSRLQADAGPGPRHSHSVMTHLDHMYLYGGLRGLREQRDLWRWSSSSHTWSCIKALSGPSRLVGHTAVVCKDSMLLYGGGETQHSPRNCLWRLDLTNLTWEKLAVLPGAVPPCRIHHRSVGLGPSFQPGPANGVHAGGVPKNSIGDKFRPFKNKCFPLSADAWPETIELQTLQSSFPDIGLALKEAKLRGSCLTFENQTCDWDCGVMPEQTEGTVAHHMPDLLLVLGGKPLGGQAAISVWQMTLADL